MRRVSPGGARLAGQLFLQCDSQGRIIWMNDRARTRLGAAGNLLQSLPPEHRVPLQRLLATPVPPHESVQSCFHACGRQAPLPIRLSRLLATETGVLLSAEVRERRADSAGADLSLDMLLQLRGRMVSQYFRLLEARARLERRQPRHPHRLAAWAAEQIERDRTRVARELHGGAGQALAGIMLQLEILDSALRDAPASVRAALQCLAELAEAALDQVRNVAHRLHAPDWQSLPLARALQGLWRQMGIAQKFQACLEMAPMAEDPPPPVRALIYRAAQETLSNVIRHSGATRVRLSLEPRGSSLYFSVEDDGKGFDPDAPATGIGLRSVREQIQEMGGEFRILSCPKTTQIVVILPMMSPDEQ